LSIRTIGRLRRWVFSASLARVASFSRVSSSLRATNHSSVEVIFGKLMGPSVSSGLSLVRPDEAPKLIGLVVET
jgi:hypothetical protein